MDPKKAETGAMASVAGLELADKQIRALCDKVLPHTPHLLSVPTKTPYMPVFPHENQNTPFEQWEVMSLQYMTLVSNGDRGVGYAQGNWEDAMNAKSPESAELPSSTATPNPVKDPKKIPAVKMSIADYKSLKTTGAKPSPKPAAATPESRPKHGAVDRNPTHARNTSNISVDAPMARVPSLEGKDQRPNGIGATSKNDQVQQNASSKEDRTIIPPRSKAPETKDTDRPRPVVNGNSARDSLHVKDSNKDPRSRPDSQNAVKESTKHALPPRPQSPRRNVSESKKRPLESGAASQPEKRLRIDPAESRTSSHPPKPSPRKVEESKPSPKSQKPSQSTPSHPSPPPKKATPSNAKPLDTRGHSSKSSISEKPLNLPPLLSPLPADLETPPQPIPGSLKKSESSKPRPKTPSQNLKSISSDTIVVKQPHSKKDIPTSSPLSTPPKSSPPFVMPRLLSPDLPDIVEAELQRLQQKSATLNSVEARHEKARQPGALGVAQKRPKVGHPPKKSHTESSNSAKKTIVVEKPPSLIVKMSYKKRDSKHIQGLLRLKPRPSNEFKTLEAQRLEREKSSSVVPPPKDESESEEDVPLATNRATKAPAPVSSASRKRPTDSSDRNEPTSKRAKIPETISVAKGSSQLAPPFKSPSFNAPTAVRDSAVLSTPKKGDAMKSVAMRKVDSSDGHARTPQALSTSTPASAEKPRTKSERVIDQDALARARAEEAKFYPLGTDAKRLMQAILGKKNITEVERKEAIMKGIEGLMAYMLAFHHRDRVEILSYRPQTPQSWEQFFPIWIFVEQNARPIPELRALLDQLGAVSREQLIRVYTNLPEESRNWDKLVKCLKDRDATWGQCRRNKDYIADIGVQGTLGPWSSVFEAVGYGVATLTYYASSQQMRWEGDPNFSNAFTKQFMKAGDAPKLKEIRVAREGKGVPEDIAALVG